MSESETSTPQGAMAERLRKTKELTSMTVQGARSTVESTAEMAAGEASMTAEAASVATQSLSDTVGRATTNAMQGMAHGA
ncbi:MAG TPA: hypothetical protein PK170_09765, partial [Anaerolineae bacterium]|nr:hypothetical protein [Anaerolineae bacterium]